MADAFEEDYDYPDVEYPALVDYAERVMVSHLTDVEWLTLHEMADSNPDLFPEGGISDRDAHVVDAIMSLTTVTYSWPTPEEVQAKVRKALKEPEEK